MTWLHLVVQLLVCLAQPEALFCNYLSICDSVDIHSLVRKYGEGALDIHSEHRDTAVQVDNSCMACAVEQLGPGTIVDWEVDELREWITALNFDE